MTTDTPPPPLPLRTRSAMRVRHGVGLARELGRYGRAAGLWWLVPLAVVIALVSLAVTTTTTALPVTVYTLF